MRSSQTGFAFGLVAVALAAPAAADTFGAQVHYATGKADLNGRELTAPLLTNEPDIPKAGTLRLKGDGELSGGTLRAELLLDQTRLGLGAGMFGISDTQVVATALPEGVRLETGSMWMFNYEVFIGRELAQGPVYPYFDARLFLDLMQVQVEVHTDDLGHVGTNPYNVLSLGVGPRIGMLIPIGHSTMIDINATHRVVGGLSQVMLMMGLGYWENDRDDEFSQSLKGSWRGDF